MSGEGKVVCVTGASGFIASWLVKLLLRRGYTVHATVRSLNGAKERLHLFEADLLEENSFDSAINGCDGVFHTASPVSFSPTKAEIVDPAVKGTLNVLGSCVRTPSMKRQWYSLSKILAEEAAWKYAGENGIDMVSLHPSLVIGPILQPTLNFSTNVILGLIKEEKGFFSGAGCSYVDVRDVANAHIQAFEVPSASGRYCLVGETIHSSQVLKIAGQLYPSLPISNKYKGEDLPVAPTFKVSQEKAKSLGINFTSFAVTLKDTIESLKEKNFLSF
nr:cinnamoyl-CoA reductase 1-like [Ipomoea batatas]